jgi:hypothetical protein
MREQWLTCVNTIIKRRVTQEAGVVEQLSDYGLLKN